jgi:hypothetical protein
MSDQKPQWKIDAQKNAERSEELASQSKGVTKFFHSIAAKIYKLSAK